MKKAKLQLNILFVNLLIFLPLFVSAATLYLEPDNGQYQPGDSFSVKIRIDTDGECINAVEVHLGFSKDILKAIDFSQGESILTLWTKSPEINQEKGEISFSGGIPGGYCGRIPGDPGTSGLLGKIIFMVPGTTVKLSEENIAEIQFSDKSQVLLNDGLGTPAKLKTQGSIFEIISKGEPLREEWKKELSGDAVVPEPFTIVIQKDPAVFNGEYFIIFSTTDKQTGIDYYEVKEGKDDWQKAESPYLLENQDLNSIIQVRAVDKAGNERMAEYLPVQKPFLYLYWKFITLILLISVITWLCWKYLRKTKP